MKKTILAFLFILVITGVNTVIATESNDWETNITVSSGNVENRLSFGQKPAATDFRDGFYDAPAMLSGKLQAYFMDNEGALWRDNRGPDPTQEWQLIIASQTNQPITITWDSANLPENSTIELFDSAGGNVIDMQSSNAYTLGNMNRYEISIKYAAHK